MINKTRIRRIWSHMKDRCLNPKNDCYHNYGGRGITVCESWLKSSNNFYYWAINNGYSDELTIDRIDYNKGYSPENCRWATRKQQQNNTRACRIIEHGGIKRNVTQWAEATSIKRVTIKQRLMRGWPVERCLTDNIAIRTAKW